jgi:hypothetical protein
VQYRVKILRRAKHVSLLHNSKTVSRAHPTSLSIVTGFISWGLSGGHVILSTKLLLVPTLRMRGGIPPLLLYGFMM